MRVPVERLGESKPPTSSGIEWLTSYGDMVTLLLTFFILLYGISLQEKKRETSEPGDGQLEQILAVLATRFGATPSPIELAPGQSVVEATNGNKLVELLQLALTDKSKGDIQIEGVPGGVRVTLPGELLFDSGEDQLRPEALSTLDSLAETILQQKEQYEIHIEGHTDNVPVNATSNRYKDNLELSSRRAMGVMRYFMEKHGIDPRMMTAVGKGEWHPVDANADNDSEDARRRNRRVEMFLEARPEAAPPTLEGAEPTPDVPEPAP